MTDRTERVARAICAYYATTDAPSYVEQHWPKYIAAARAALAAADAWQPIETAPNNRVLLVQHVDDLYPVVAYQVPEETLWVYEQDGPEDITEPGDHRHTPLKRTPTHWQPLPALPENSK